MLKIPENKTRKKLRITLCVLYLVEIVLCALPYFQYIDEKNVLHSYSVFDIMSVWGSIRSLCRFSSLFRLQDFSSALLTKNAI